MRPMLSSAYAVRLPAPDGTSARTSPREPTCTTQSPQAPFRTTPSTFGPEPGRVAGAKIDCELIEGIAGVAVTVPPVERNRATQSPAAAMASATNEINRKAAAICAVTDPMRLGFGPGHRVGQPPTVRAASAPV